MPREENRTSQPGTQDLEPRAHSRRSELAERVADIVLDHGLADFGLRGLAAKLGTSDRMLIYYFETKDQLVIDVLDTISVRLSNILAVHSDGPRVSAGQFLGNVLALAGDPRIAPFMRLWTNVISRGAAGEAPYDQVCTRVVQAWIAWIDSRLTRPVDTSEDARPAALLCIVEGISLLELASPGSTKSVGVYLAKMLDPHRPSGS